MDTKWCHPNICIGTGKYPRCDPWGRPFTAQYHPHRMRLAGKRIAGNYVGVLEAFQGDQDFIRILFSPSRCIAAFLGNYKYVGFIRFAPHHYIADFPKKSFNHQTMQPRFFFPGNFAAIIAGHVNGFIKMTTPSWMITCTQILDQLLHTAIRTLMSKLESFLSFYFPRNSSAMFS